MVCVYFIDMISTIVIIIPGPGIPKKGLQMGDPNDIDNFPDPNVALVVLVIVSVLVRVRNVPFDSALFIKKRRLNRQQTKIPSGKQT